MAGGIAIHLHRIIVNRSKAPKVFVAAIDRGEDIAHMFDQNLNRLMTTARRLGVRVVRVERKGTKYQHIDLVGSPLARAVAEAERTREQEAGRVGEVSGVQTPQA